ncbi:MAG: TMEM175 family protein [Lapillicoccus sp.]
MARFPRAHRAGVDRFVNFSDATVAIAMTLLVLPLVELGGETEEGESVWGLLTGNGYAIFGFVLSFLVIWSMWVNHHRVMEFFADYDSTVMTLHLIWLLTMVSIPFTTELLTTPISTHTGRLRCTSPFSWCRRSPCTCSAGTAAGTQSCCTTGPRSKGGWTGPTRGRRPP